ncbi:APC family permease [Granulosicoccaceae sp. 1_MG-2023]|nr:APC family permease [Granulosicoccaceae sp. 1_MG-2023]
MATELKRCLPLSQVVIYGVGLILGAGVYVLIGTAAGLAGNMLWLSFLLAALVAGFTAASYAELSCLFPQAAAEYLYIRTAFGSDALAWIVGVVAIVIGFSTASAVATGFADYAAYFIPLDRTLCAALLIAVMSLVSYLGIRQSAALNTVATGIEVGGLLLIIGAGGWAMLRGGLQPADLSALPQGSDGASVLPVISAAALIFFAYMGFEDIANIAEETRDPQRTLPRAFLLALLISTVIYILVAIVAVSVIPAAELAGTEQPLAAVMLVLIGGHTPTLMALIALFATANTVLITLIVCARMIYGIARSNALPAVLARVHPRRQTPVAAIVLTGLASGCFLLLGGIHILASVSDIGIFILFLMVNLSNILLRYKRPHCTRAWRTPLNIGRFPLLSLAGALSCVGMLFSIDHPVQIAGHTLSGLAVGLSVFALTVPLYLIFGRRRPAPQ